MNSALYTPLSIEIRRLESSESFDSELYFDIGLRWTLEGAVQWLTWVYVPKSLQPLLLEGRAASIHLETLAINGEAALCLPQQTETLLLGLIDKDGRRHSEIPEKIRKSRRLNLGVGGGSVVGGLVLIAIGHAWLGAGLLWAGQHFLRTAKSVRFEPFKVYRRCRCREVPPSA